MKKGFDCFLAQNPNWHFKGYNLNAETYRCLGVLSFFAGSAEQAEKANTRTVRAATARSAVRILVIRMIEKILSLGKWG